jgi:hypothetical protein
MTRIFQNLLPYMGLAEWGGSDTEAILQAIMLCRENNLGAISTISANLPVLASLAGDIKVYCLADNPGRIAKNACVQLFVKKEKIEEIPPGAIPALSLKEMEHSDWIRLMSANCGAAGFMLIDDNGRHIHRLYDFLDSVGGSFDGEIHYCGLTNDIAKLESARRLVEKIRPNLLPHLKLFVSREFFKNLDIGRKSL